MEGRIQGTQNTIGSTLFCFPKSKQIICLLEGWIRQKTVNKCKQMYFVTETAQLIFGGLNIDNKQYSTFTFMFLGRMSVKKTEHNYFFYPQTYDLSGNREK